MRVLLLLFAGAAAAYPQFHAGLKAGVPLTDFFTTVQSTNFGFNSNTKRYIVGGTAQLDLPLGFAVGFDALYRHLNYDATSFTAPITSFTTTANAWEFPLTVKYRFHTPIARPYLEGGIAWNKLTGVKQSVSTAVGLSSTSADLQNTTVTGAVLGAGVDVHAIFIHVVPGIRYTRWASTNFRQAVGGLFESNRNQAEFLLGITF